MQAKKEASYAEGYNRETSRPRRTEKGQSFMDTRGNYCCAFNILIIVIIIRVRMIII